MRAIGEHPWHRAMSHNSSSCFTSLVEEGPLQSKHPSRHAAAVVPAMILNLILNLGSSPVSCQRIAFIEPRRPRGGPSCYLPS